MKTISWEFNRSPAHKIIGKVNGLICYIDIGNTLGVFSETDNQKAGAIAVFKPKRKRELI